MILGTIPGATPDKWVDRWQHRYPSHGLELRHYDDAGQLERIAAGTVDLGYIRFREGEDQVDRDLCHRVLLYREEPVVCAAAGHWIAAAEDSVSVDELAKESSLDPKAMIAGSGPADIHSSKAGADLARAERTALEVVASGAGVVVLPNSVARMLSRKDVVIRRIEDSPGFDTGLAWLRDRDDDLIQEFIGIARGRKAGSGRSQLSAKKAKPEAAPGARSRQRSRLQPRSPRARPPRGRRRPR
ncbi:LysR substrate-binding domain-containing protein [Nesterenkonia muleiensis]|uniref:LysR substrate-binding domain-containing protein n=1 Tax=Nesterenkonia muleiensis TaxID=2282648 RepID=UPI000E72E610|nr:LysR substrate-binding domain-containing protein [Nesterenkonia muleiensis]